MQGDRQTTKHPGLITPDNPPGSLRSPVPLQRGTD